MNDLTFPLDIVLRDDETPDTLAATLSDRFGVSITLTPDQGCPGGPSYTVTAPTPSAKRALMSWYYNDGGTKPRKNSPTQTSPAPPTPAPGKV